MMHNSGLANCGGSLTRCSSDQASIVTVVDSAMRSGCVSVSRFMSSPCSVCSCSVFIVCRVSLLVQLRAVLDPDAVTFTHSHPFACRESRIQASSTIDRDSLTRVHMTIHS